MSMPHVPYTFASGETLTPRKLTGNLKQIAADVSDNLSKRFYYSSFVLDFSGCSGTPSEEKTFRIKAPYYYEIVGVELVLYHASGSTVTLSATGSGLSGWTDVSVASAGATTKAKEVANFVASNTADTEVAFTISTASLTSCKAVIHIRTDRGNAGASHAEYTPTTIASGAAVARATLNSEFTSATAAVARDTNNDKGQRIQVFARRGAGALTVARNSIRIPSSSQRIAAFDIVVVSTVNTDTVQGSFDDGGGAVVGNVTSAVNTYSRTTVNTSLPGALANLPTTPASDGIGGLSRGGTNTHALDYLVLYWS